MSLKKETRLDILLHRASFSGDSEGIINILETGRVYVDCADREGTTPLHLAVLRKNHSAILELLIQGADPNAKRHETGTTPILLAAQNGDLLSFRILVENGGKTNVCNKDGGTAVFIASQQGHTNFLRELLSIGGCVHLNKPMRDGATPLFVSSQNGHYETVELLISNGAAINAQRNDGATALWIASQMGHSYICSKLIENGADVNVLRTDGVSSLYKACQKGFDDIVRMLIKKNPDLGLLPIGETCLHAAVRKNHVKIVQILLRAGSDPYLVDLKGISPIDLAIKLNYFNLAYLLRKGLEILS